VLDEVDGRLVQLCGLLLHHDRTRAGDLLRDWKWRLAAEFFDHVGGVA